MDQKTVIAIVVAVALIVIAAVVVVFSRRRRSLQLKEHFGPEYERTLRMRGDANKAEAELLNREKRDSGLDSLIVFCSDGLGATSKNK